MNIQLADAPEDVQYFGWALEHLPEGKMASGLLAVPDALPSDVAVNRVRSVYGDYLYRATPEDIYIAGGRYRRDPFPYRGGSPSGRAVLYTDIVNNDPDRIRSAPGELYDADRNLDGTIDDLAYRAMLASFLGAFDGDSYAIQLLATLMLRGSLNRQHTIARFLGVVTRGQVSLLPGPPQKTEVVGLARSVVAGDVNIEGQLAQVIRSYAYFVSAPPGRERAR